MKRTFFILAAYAALATYPAYLQSERAVNGWLDEFAAERVGLSTSQAQDYIAVAEGMPDHLKAPLPVRKGGE